MKKIIFALSISLIVGAGVFLSASNNSKPIDLAKSNIEASCVSAVSADCVGEVQGDCHENHVYKPGSLVIYN